MILRRFLVVMCFALAGTATRYDATGEERKPVRLADGLDAHRSTAVKPPIVRASRSLHALLVEQDDRFIGAHFVRVLDRWQNEPLFFAGQKFLGEGAYEQVIGWVRSDLSSRAFESLWVAQDGSGGAVAIWSSARLSVVATLSKDEVKELDEIRARIAGIVKNTRIEERENLYDGDYALCMVINKESEMCLFSHGFKDETDEDAILKEQETIMKWIRKRTAERPFAEKP